MEPMRLLIADDHPLFRDGLRVLLESVPDMQVIEEATTGNEVVVLAASLQPDVILMDIKMPGLNGIEATRRILHTSPHIRILKLIMPLRGSYPIFALMVHGKDKKRETDESFSGLPGQAQDA